MDKDISEFPIIESAAQESASIINHKVRIVIQFVLKVKSLHKYSGT